MRHDREARAGARREAAVPRAAALVLPDYGQTVLRDGVRQRRRSHVPDPAVRQVQRADRRLLRGRDRHRPLLPALARNRLPRPQARQRAARPRWPHQDRRLRHVQGEHLRRQDHQDLLRDAGLHRARNHLVPALWQVCKY